MTEEILWRCNWCGWKIDKQDAQENGWKEIEKKIDTKRGEMTIIKHKCSDCQNEQTRRKNKMGDIDEEMER